MLEQTIDKKGQAAATKLWEEVLAERLARSGGGRKRGANLTPAIRKRGWKTRGQQLRRDQAHQRMAQTASSRARRSARGTIRNKLRQSERALAKPAEAELTLFATYLARRQEKQRKED